MLIIRALYNLVFYYFSKILFAIKRPEKEVVVILGMHRSGTSSIAGAFAKVGYYPGDRLLRPSEFNKEGFFEDKDIIWLNDSVLAYNKLKWYNVGDEKIKFNSSFSHLLNRILWSKYNHADKIVLKDPRICLLLPLYSKVLRNLNWNVKTVVIKRQKCSIINSLNSRNPSLSIDVDSLIERYYSEVEGNNVYDSIEVQFEDLLSGSEIEMLRLQKFLKLEPTAMTDFKSQFKKGFKNF